MTCLNVRIDYPEVRDRIAHIGREDLLSHINLLQTFFMTCLNVRIDYPEVRHHIAHIGREITSLT